METVGPPVLQGLRPGTIIYTRVHIQLAMKVKYQNRQALGTLLRHTNGAYSRGRTFSTSPSMFSVTSTGSTRSYTTASAAGRPLVPCVVLWVGSPSISQAIIAPIIRREFPAELTPEDEENQNIYRQMCFPVPDTTPHLVITSCRNEQGEVEDVITLQEYVDIPMWKFRNGVRDRTTGELVIDTRPQQVILGAPIQCQVSSMAGTAPKKHNLPQETLDFCRRRALNEMNQDQVVMLGLLDGQHILRTHFFPYLNQFLAELSEYEMK
jgi:hypothetical protein